MVLSSAPLHQELQELQSLLAGGGAGVRPPPPRGKTRCSASEPLFHTGLNLMRPTVDRPELKLPRQIRRGSAPVTSLSPASADIAVVEMTDAFRQLSLFYHLGVRESFSMANNIILYCDTNSDSLQSLQWIFVVEGSGAALRKLTFDTVFH
ncbi:Mitogen-activated protein kinase kinase kinase 5 [Takifugu flavidus]|uniref:Mitogen-activated protein kinase kinase kinase 5 n=1 Tax=Takifugu flavidus TaxID=433684 RepID=A0A5C6NMI8_9TELE|nr:Mitogen-activated protein kinase kinase kinase 5 [Takifugu flavidus]